MLLIIIWVILRKFLWFSVSLIQGCQTHFHRGPHQLGSCLQRAKIILGLYKCNYSLTLKELKLHSAFEGNHEADVAPSENEFDTPALREDSCGSKESEGQLEELHSNKA